MMRGSGLAICCAVLAAACGSSGTQSSALAASLRGREFLSESVEGKSLVAGTRIRVQFAAQELNVYAGCNHLSGPYQIEGDVLKLRGLGRTEIGCEPALQAQDEWIADLLVASPAIELDEPRLSLSAGDVRVILLDRSVASPDRPLVGTRWIGNGQGDGSAVGIGPGSTATHVTFGTDGRVDVFTACQTGTGQFSASATTITFVGLGYDGAACTNEALAMVSTQVLSVLDGQPVTYEIKEASLTITSPKDGHQLFYRADEQDASP